MKRKCAALFIAMVLMLAGCGQNAAVASSMAESEPVATSQAVQTPESNKLEKEMAEPSAAPQETATPKETETVAKAATPAPTQVPTPAPTPEPTQAPAPTAAPTAVPAAAAPVTLSYGAIPFELAASDGTWWQIDSSDSAYWATQENINAIRAAGGLGSLSMSEDLSASANTRCENFVPGGAFDHSGMITKSEICASGPIGSASAVCSAWQGSADHYANIMRTDISSMGVACWFCSVNGSNYTYWVVTFE